MKKVFTFIIVFILFMVVLECQGQSFHSKKYNTRKWHKTVSFCITGPRYNPSIPNKTVSDRTRRFIWIRRNKLK